MSKLLSSPKHEIHGGVITSGCETKFIVMDVALKNIDGKIIVIVKT